MDMNTVSMATQAERLELFENNLRLADQNAMLTEKLRAKEVEHVAELSRALHQAGDPIQIAIDILQTHQQYQDKLTQTERQRDLFDNENIELRDLLEEATSANTALRDQVTHYKGECEAQLAQHNKEAQKAQADLEALARQLASATAELKELRAHNPQRLAKQVKELQKKNRELIDGNQQLRILTNANQKIRKEHEERGRVIVALEDKNQQLQAALCTPTSEGEASPMDTLDGWEFYPHSKDDDRLVLLHEQSGTSRLYERGTGFRKLPALPAKIKTRAEAIIANGCKHLEVA